MKTILPILLALLSVHAGSSFAEPTKEDCLACHGDSSLTMERQGKSISLHVAGAALEKSVHGGLSCVECHQGFDAANLPHKEKIVPVDCQGCHGDVSAEHRFHPDTVSVAGPGSPAGGTCKKCHGTHEIVRVRGDDPKAGAARLSAFCGRCHAEVVRHYLESEHGRAAAGNGAAQAPGCITCHGKPITKGSGVGDGARLKLTQDQLCLSCHLDDPAVRARMGPGAGFIAAYEKSVHGAALRGGNEAAAGCVDCHGSHEVKRGMDPDSRVSKARIPGTCARCHGKVAAEYAESVHGLAVKRGNLEAPVCTDCHGEHNILFHNDPRSPVAFANLSERVCGTCHSSVRLSEKYGIAADRSGSFEASYHGLAIRGGSVEVANCASCHGAHAIKPSSDPASSVNKANLKATCGKCHQGANAKFAMGSVHLVMSAKREPLLYWIAAIYTSMIVIVVGGMFLHNLLDYLRKTVRRFRRLGMDAAGEAEGQALYLRMTAGERLQHIALVASFTVLVLTGFMLRYPESWWASTIRSLSVHAFEARSLAHRIAAVVMVSAALAHVVYAVFTTRGREFIRDIFPRRKDLQDMVMQVGWNLGMVKRKPRFGRFSYVEKSEYWALVWGTILMAGTGGILWFENTFIGLLTKLGWDVARTIHFYEAVLAALAILVWHLYFVIFNPDVYPMSPAWITGYLSEAQMAEEHPLELEKIRRREQEEALAQAEAEAATQARASEDGSEDAPAPRQETEHGR